MNTHDLMQMRMRVLGVIFLFLIVSLICFKLDVAKALPDPELRNAIAPMYMPASTDQIPIYVEIASLDPASSFHVKLRLKQSGRYFGETYDLESDQWLRQTSSWTEFPTLTSDETGNVSSWMTFKPASELSTTVDAEFELVLRPVGTSTNLPAINIDSINVYVPDPSSSDPGDYVRGSAIFSPLADPNKQAIVGRNSQNKIVCIGSVASKSDQQSAASSEAIKIPFMFPCPLTLSTLSSRSMSLDESMPSSNDSTLTFDLEAMRNFASLEIVTLNENPHTVETALTRNFVPVHDFGAANIAGTAIASGDGDQQIAQIEYFVGTDPGEGQGVSIIADDGANDESIEEFDISLNTYSLFEAYDDTETMSVNVRSQNISGVWSEVVTADIHSYELVFVDEDRENSFFITPSLALCAFEGERKYGHSDKCNVRLAGEYGYFVSIRDRKWRFEAFYSPSDGVFAGRSWYLDEPGKALLIDDGVSITI